MPRCTKCFEWGHTAEECTKNIAPKARLVKPCPYCMTPVTKEEAVRHKELGCHNVNKPVVRNDE